jgi:1-acyl-sn-glycerol-3-phosphate acyltransferase
MKIRATLKFYWGAFIISTIVAVVMIPAIFLFKKYKGIIIHKLNRLMLVLLGGKIEQYGAMDTSVDIYVMNHQGIIDIIGLEALQTNHLRWVAKQELFDAFWFGNLLKLGEMIPIKRSNKAGLRKLLREIKASKEKYHRAVAIFPEGTRTDKQALLPFKEGTKVIVETLRLKVQPIVITGSKALLDEHTKTASASTVHYTFLEPIDVTTTDENWYIQLKENMQKVIDEYYHDHHICR